MLSHIATVARGSVAGINYTANPYSRIVCRSKPIPSQPHSLLQTHIRSSMTENQLRWAGLTPTGRTNWDNYARSLSPSGPTGPYTLTGRLVFMANNTFARYLFKRGFITTEPSAAPPTTLGALTIRNLNIHTPPGDGRGYRIAGRNQNPEDIMIVIMNSRSFDPAKRYHSSPFKTNIIFGGRVNAFNAFSFDVTNIIPGMRYFCRVRAVVTNDPIRLSPIFYYNTLAAIAPPGYVIPPQPPEEPL